MGSLGFFFIQLTYADDAFILSQTRVGLQMALQYISLQFLTEKECNKAR